MADPKTPAKGRHRRWIVHTHEATQPSHTDAKSDINITPLIDVMLVLLIIFMVVTPLTQKGLDIALPQPIESLVSTPANSSMAGQREPDHRAGEVVARKQITRGRVMRLRPCIDPVAVGNNRGR
jgi:hypothetical protein